MKNFIIPALAVTVFASILFNAETKKNKETFKYYSSPDKVFVNNQCNPELPVIQPEIAEIVSIPENSDMVFFPDNDIVCVIGSDNPAETDNPTDNSVTFNIADGIDENCSVILEYDLFGLKDNSSVCKSINDNIATGGLVVKTSDKWSHQTESISAEVLKLGENKIRFSLPEGLEIKYEVKNIRIKIQKGNFSGRRIEINQNPLQTYYGQYAYVSGFLSGKNTKNVKVLANGNEINFHKGVFEGIVPLNPDDSRKKSVVLTAIFEDGETINENIFFTENSDYDYINLNRAEIAYVENFALPQEKFELNLNSLSLKADQGFISQGISISATGLRAVDMPMPDMAMVNVTAQNAGYRCLPHGSQFESDIEIGIKYDPALIPSGYGAEDIRTFFFDESCQKWVMLELDSIDVENNTIISKTNHFTDFIDAILKAPELPQTEAFTPTSLKDLDYAQPLAGINMISPPQANNSGSANLSFPLQLPAGRHGMQPNLAITYNSDGGNGPFGVGWDINIPAITVDTRWGVPRYNSLLESEEYLVNGEQIVQLESGQFQDRMDMLHNDPAIRPRTINEIVYFSKRVEGEFSKIIRHGSSTANYWWEIIDKNGTQYLYGKYNDVSIVDECKLKDTETGNISSWPLTEVRDINGNTIIYKYTVESGIDGGKQLFISKIFYTGFGNEIGKYKIEFLKEARTDKFTSCRYGFLVETSSRINRINIIYDNNPVRSYILNYKEGAYGKSLLATIADVTDFTKISNVTGITDCEDVIQYFGATVHCFDYFTESGIEFETNPTTVTNLDDAPLVIANEYNDYTDPITMTLEKSLSISGLGGASACLGLGLDFSSKINSVGISILTGAGVNFDQIQMLDINGDNIVDKLFLDHGDVYFYRGIVDQNNHHHFSETASLIEGLPSLGRTWDLSPAAGGEIQAGGIFASGFVSYQYSTTLQINTRYFADINADGFVDFINNGKAYFNFPNSSGQPIFTLEISNTLPNYYDDDCYLESEAGVLADADMEGVDISARRDPVIMWKAPDDVKILIQASLQRNLSDIFLQSDVEFIGQVEPNGTPFCKTIHPAEYNNFTWNFPLDAYSNPEEVSLSKGDVVYFRLHPTNPNGFDDISTQLQISVVEVNNVPTDLSAVDADGKEMYIYRYEDDVLVNDKSLFTAPYSGTVSISGILQGLDGQSARLTFKVIKRALQNNNSYVETELINTSFNSGLDIDADVSELYSNPFQLAIGDEIIFRLESNSNINWNEIEFVNPKITYLNYVVDGVTHTEQVEFYPNLQLEVYPNNVCFSNPVNLVAGTPYKFIPNITTFPSDFSGHVFLTVKKSKKLISERELDVLNGTILNSPIIIQYTPFSNETVYFDYYTDNEDVSDANVNSGVDIYANNVLITTKPAGFYSKISQEYEIFGNLYRGWGQFSYLKNDVSACSPIDETLLFVDQSFISEDLFDEDEDFPDVTINDETSYESVTGSFSSANIPDMINKPFEIMITDVKNSRWADLCQSAYCSETSVGSGIGVNTAYNILVTYAADQLDGDNEMPRSDTHIPNGGNFPVPNKIVRLENHTVSAMLGIGTSWGANFGPTKSWTTSECWTDYLDMNGDRFPDVVNKKQIQYTNSKGTLSEVIEFDEGVKVFPSVGSGASDGMAAGVKGTKMSGGFVGSGINSEIPNISGSFAIGETDAISEVSFVYADINGDGLADRINKEDNSVELNMGYSFTPSTIYDISSIIKLSYSASHSVSGSFSVIPCYNINQFSKSAGISGSQNTSNELITMADVNNDGLFDIVSVVIPTFSISVKFNTGSGFTDYVECSGYGENSFNKTFTTNLGINISNTFGGPVSTGVKAVASVYGDASFSIPRKLSSLKDVNGDGYPDYIYVDDNNNAINIHHGIAKKTNILKSVTTPGFSTYNMDYSLKETSIDDPNSRWEMTELQVYDDFDNDGHNYNRYIFAYENPVYHRLERDFFGFENVITKQLYDNDNVYRIDKKQYNVSSIYLKGVLVSDFVFGNSETVKFTETVYTTDLKSIETGEVLSENNQNCTNFYPAISFEEKKYYEENTSPQIISKKEYIHGPYGNVVQYINHNNADPSYTDDDIKADIIYNTNSVLLNQNLTGLVSEMKIYNDVPTNLLRNSKGTYNSNGSLRKIENFDGTNWTATDLSYDSYGNVLLIEYPANTVNERLSYIYEYDPYIHTYPVEITDYWGNSFTSTYDYKLGLPLVVTDQSGNQMQYSYYVNGNLNTITGPNEIAAGVPYTIKYEYWTELNNTSPARWARTRHYDPINTGNEFLTVNISDGLGRIVQSKKRTVVNGMTNTVVSGNISYDEFGRAVSVSQPLGIAYNSSTFTDFTTFTSSYSASTEYDVLDRTKKQTAMDGEETIIGYDTGADAFGNMAFKTIITDPNLLETTKFTDVRGLQTSVTSPLNTTTKFTYSPLGELLTSTDPENNVTTYEYDLLGRLVSRDHPDANTTTYTYDMAGNVLSVVTEKLNSISEQIQYIYEDCRLSEIQYPVNPEMNVYYQYGAPGTGNQAGRLIKQQDASGVQTFTYGKMGELISNRHTFVVPGGSSYTFGTSWQYDSWNRIKSITYPDSEVVTYGYDDGGQLLTMYGTKAGVTYQYISTIKYDKFGNRIRICYGNNVNTYYTYNPANLRLSNLRTTQNGGIEMQNITYSYDPVGNIESLSNSAGYVNGNIGGTYSYNYTYDDLYRLESSSGEFLPFGSLTPNTYSLGMVYSASGNITNKTLASQRLINGSTTNLSYNNNYAYTGRPHTVSSRSNYETYTWDLNGNMTSRNKLLIENRSLCWDEENRLSAVRSAPAFIFSSSQLSSYIYDASGERAWKLTGTETQMQLNAKTVIRTVDFEKTFYFSPLMVMTETEYTKHYYIEGERICSKIGGGFGTRLLMPLPFIEGDLNTFKVALSDLVDRDVRCVGYTGIFTIDPVLPSAANTNFDVENLRYFYHPDHLGSSSMISNTSGLAEQHIQYLPFGELFVSQRNSTFDSRYKFTAKELDNETNYTYFGARYYDSDLSSWLSVDPMAKERPNISPYAYCQNNPVMRVDPSGALDVKNLDWFQNIKTGEIVYHKDYGKDDANMLGEDYSHLGEDNMFGEAPIDIYNSVMGADVKETTSFGLGAEKSEKFMDKNGYKLVTTKVKVENCIKQNNYSVNYSRTKMYRGTSLTTGIRVGYVKKGMVLVRAQNTEHLSYDINYNFWSNTYTTKESYVEDWVWGSQKKSNWFAENWKFYAGELDRVTYENVNIRK